MNRNNFWIHLGIAVVVITFAAVLGQISRWQYSRYTKSVEKKSTTENPLRQNARPKIVRPKFWLNSVRT
jgi:hypothetical protein